MTCGVIDLVRIQVRSFLGVFSTFPEVTAALFVAIMHTSQQKRTAKCSEQTKTSGGINFAMRPCITKQC